MLILTTTQLLRALFVITLVTKTYGDDFVTVSYDVWLVCTRWFPHILCSLLLINEMRQSTRNNSQASEYAVIDISTSSLILPINDDDVSDSSESFNGNKITNVSTDFKSDLGWSFSDTSSSAAGGLLGRLKWGGSQTSLQSSEGSNLSTQYLVLHQAFTERARLHSNTLRDASLDKT